MTHDALLILAAFSASAVEMVEAATIVLAVGITYTWRTSLSAGLAALLVLGALTAVLGPSLTKLVPLNILQLVVGSLLLAFGLQWLCKAVQRAAGLRAQRDESAIFKREIEDLRFLRDEQGSSQTAGFIISFKGVFLEGLEVAFIVITFGGASGRTDLAAIGAAAAAALVVVVAILAHGPLSRVPENAIKLGVGVMLMAFGTFWGAEGAGVDWFAGDATLLILVAMYAAIALGASEALRRRQVRPAAGSAAVAESAGGQGLIRWPVEFVRFWYSFLIGDSPVLPVGTAAALAACWAFSQAGAPSAGEVALPGIAVVTLGLGVTRR